VKDLRDVYIGKVAKGKSFAEVGGLWGTVNEKVSVAHTDGASDLAMIDVSPPESDLWRLFEERRQALQLPEVRCVSSDLVTLAEGASYPQFDVVHCSGILYHIPDPLRFLRALRAVTREFLVLTSVVTAARITTNQGTLEIPRAAALFVPALQERERAILQTYWQQFVGNDAIGLTREIKVWNLDDFAPWWWLPTVEALEALCMAAGFERREGGYIWNNNAYVQLLSVRS
jgi:SAM-dependent methyltransferase